ncbi:MAG: hypothetical protein QM539_03860 [Alphaproteobacteria bacterium]|nr:hypothetical protein [Alphaproteobacteria bacterium]
METMFLMAYILLIILIILFIINVIDSLQNSYKNGYYSGYYKKLLLTDAQKKEYIKSFGIDDLEITSK